MKFVKTTVTEIELKWVRDETDPRGDYDLIDIRGLRFVAYIRKDECTFEARFGRDWKRVDSEQAAVAWVESRLPDVFGERVE